jgi:hypothetical protein
MTCDCGYRFVGAANQSAVLAPTDDSGLYLRSIAESLRSIRNMILFWIVASLAAGAIWGVILAYGASKQREAVRTFQERIQKEVPSPNR